MAKARKKPVEVDYFLFESIGSVNEAVSKSNSPFMALAPKIHWKGDDMIIHTLEGDMVARFGDYIIRGVKGEFYPCKADIFIATYDFV